MTSRNSLADDPFAALLTTTEAAEQAGVPVTTFRCWVHRGELEPAARTGAGRPLYMLIDVLRAEARTRRADPAKRRHKTVA